MSITAPAFARLHRRPGARAQQDEPEPPHVRWQVRATGEKPLEMERFSGRVRRVTFGSGRICDLFRTLIYQTRRPWRLRSWFRKGGEGAGMGSIKGGTLARRNLAAIVCGRPVHIPPAVWSGRSRSRRFGRRGARPGLCGADRAAQFGLEKRAGFVHSSSFFLPTGARETGLGGWTFSAGRRKCISQSRA